MRTTALLITMLLAALAQAGHPVSWAFAVGQNTDSTASITLTATCEEGWHLYALTLPRDDGPFPTVIAVDSSAHFRLDPAPLEPTPVEVHDPNFDMLVRYHGHVATFIVPVKRLSKEAVNVTGSVEYMCCNDKMCLPPVKVGFSVPLPAVK